MTYVHLRRTLATILAAALIAVVAAACGSSSSTSTTSHAVASSASTSSARQKLVSCLKAHGVTPPDRPRGQRAPSGGGGFAASPKLRAAFVACGGRDFPAQGLTLSHAAVTKFVACVKQHGYSLPAPNFTGNGPIFSRRIETNATFRTASRACASLLRPTGAPAPGGAAPGSGGAAPGAGTATAGGGV